MKISVNLDRVENGLYHRRRLYLWILMMKADSRRLECLNFINTFRLPPITISIVEDWRFTPIVPPDFDDPTHHPGLKEGSGHRPRLERLRIRPLGQPGGKAGIEEIELGYPGQLLVYITSADFIVSYKICRSGPGLNAGSTIANALANSEKSITRRSAVAKAGFKWGQAVRLICSMATMATGHRKLEEFKAVRKMVRFAADQPDQPGPAA